MDGDGADVDVSEEFAAGLHAAFGDSWNAEEKEAAVAVAQAEAAAATAAATTSAKDVGKLMREAYPDPDAVRGNRGLIKAMKRAMIGLRKVTVDGVEYGMLDVYNTKPNGAKARADAVGKMRTRVMDQVDQL